MHRHEPLRSTGYNPCSAKPPKAPPTEGRQPPLNSQAGKQKSPPERSNVDDQVPKARPKPRKPTQRTQARTRCAPAATDVQLLSTTAGFLVPARSSGQPSSAKALEGACRQRQGFCSSQERGQAVSRTAEGVSPARHNAAAGTALLAARASSLRRQHKDKCQDLLRSRPRPRLGHHLGQ